MLWQNLRYSRLLIPLTAAGINIAEAYLTTDQMGRLSSPCHRPWVVGRHRVLTFIAGDLRVNRELCERFVELRVRLGDRTTDNPPTKPFFKSIPESPLRFPSVPGQPFNRQRDHYSGADEFWSRMTLHSHHLVEANIVKKLGKDTGDLVRGEAPCVLLVAELHQRVFSPAMTRLNQRHMFSADAAPTEAIKQLDELAEALYGRAVAARASFKDLKTLALIINREICKTMSGGPAAKGGN